MTKQTVQLRTRQIHKTRRQAGGFIHLFIPLFIYSFIYLLIYLFINLFIYLFIYSCIYLFIHLYLYLRNDMPAVQEIDQQMEYQNVSNIYL